MMHSFVFCTVPRHVRREARGRQGFQSSRRKHDDVLERFFDAETRLLLGCMLVDGLRHGGNKVKKRHQAENKANTEAFAHDGIMRHRRSCCGMRPHKTQFSGPGNCSS